MSKYDDVVDFVDNSTKEVSKKDGLVVLRVTEGDYKKFLKKKGVDLEEVKKFESTQTEFINGAVVAIQNKFVDDYKGEDRVRLRVRTPFGRNDITVAKKRTNNNPQTGKKVERYGRVTVRMAFSRSKFDSDVLDSCEKALEAVA